MADLKGKKDLGAVVNDAIVKDSVVKRGLEFIWVVYRGDIAKLRFSQHGESSSCPLEQYYHNSSLRLDSHDGVVVTPHPAPLFIVEDTSSKRGHAGFSFGDICPGRGAHEVVIPTAEHTPDLSRLAKEHYKAMLRLACRRAMDLKRDKDIEYLSVFFTPGNTDSIGQHLNLQILGTPYTPDRRIEELRKSRDHYTRRGRCIYCDDIEGTLSHEPDRVIYKNGNVLCYVPWGSNYPFKVLIIPNKENHFAGWEGLGRVCDSMADALHYTMDNFIKIFGNVKMMWNLHILLRPELYIEDRLSPEEYFHAHIDARPFTSVGGLEGSDIYVNIPIKKQIAVLKGEVELDSAQPL